jgi:TonB family protein
MLEQPSMLKRLFVECGEALREFREGPRAFITSAIKDMGPGNRSPALFRLGLAIALLFYAVVFAGTILLWSLGHKTGTPQQPLIVYTPLQDPSLVKMPDARDESGGGGGGGRNTVKPASIGHLPAFALTNLVAPRPEEQLRPPALPFIETVKVDPRIQVERDDLVPTGLPDGSNILPSAGPGSGGGIGTGSRGGIGPDDGLGVGPGREEGIGGGIPSIGGRRKLNTQHQEAVDARPVLLNNPQPLFTEAARANKVQGVVRVRILIDSSGAVREVVIMRGLPDGLNEQAIRAAYQMHFRPALKNGQQVSYWMNNVEVEFNLR